MATQQPGAPRSNFFQEHKGPVITLLIAAILLITLMIVGHVRSYGLLLLVSIPFSLLLAFWVSCITAFILFVILKKPSDGTLFNAAAYAFAGNMLVSIGMLVIGSTLHPESFALFNRYSIFFRFILPYVTIGSVIFGAFAMGYKLFREEGIPKVTPHITKWQLWMGMFGVILACVLLYFGGVWLISEIKSLPTERPYTETIPPQIPKTDPGKTVVPVKQPPFVSIPPTPVSVKPAVKPRLSTEFNNQWPTTHVDGGKCDHQVPGNRPYQQNTQQGKWVVNPNSDFNKQFN